MPQSNQQKQHYNYGQGPLYLDGINPATGLPMGKGRFVGNVPNGGFTVTMEVQKIEHKQSYTGTNLTDLVIERGLKAGGMVKLENLNRENLKLALYGQGTKITGATVSAEPHTAYLGYSFMLGHINLDSFTSLQSGGTTPVTYAKGTDYQVNLKTGEVYILPNGAIPDDPEGSSVSATYVAGASEQVTGYSAVNKEWYLIFNGINSADGDAPVKIEAFQVRFEPPSTLDWITETEPTSLELNYEILYQPLLANVEGYEGGMFRITQLQTN